MTQWFVIYESDASMTLKEKFAAIDTETDMSLEDVVKAIEAYDRLRKNRGRPRRATYAKTQEDLARAFQLGRISRSTYYRRMKELSLPSHSPRQK